jgi:transposase
VWHNLHVTKEPGKRIPRRSLEDTRLLVVSAIENGMRPDEAARIFEVGRSTVFGWLKAKREQGPAALKVRKAPGAAPKLSEEQTTALWKMIVGKDPRQLELDFALWSRDLIRQLIHREFGVEFTPQGVGLLLRRMGLSPQRPLVRAYEQDPDRVRRWKQEQYPAIHAEAMSTGASILFADEASVRTDYHAGTTWAPIGCTPVVHGTGNRTSINMISAVSPRGKLHFSIVDGNTNSATFIDFCKKLLTDIPGRIFLIVDGHSAQSDNEICHLHGRTAHPLPPPAVLTRTQPRRMGMEKRQNRPCRPARRTHPRRNPKRNRESSHPSPNLPGDRARFLPRSRSHLHPDRPVI